MGGAKRYPSIASWRAKMMGFAKGSTHPTGLRVQRAPGIPHALNGRKIHARLGRIAPRGRGLISRIARRHCEERSDEAIYSFFARQDGLLRCARNDGPGAFARPVGSQ